MAQLVDDHKRLTIENMVLRMELRKERIERFGPSTEKLTDEQLDLLDQEPSVSPQEVEHEAQHATEPPPNPSMISTARMVCPFGFVGR